MVERIYIVQPRRDKLKQKYTYIKITVLQKKIYRYRSKKHLLIYDLILDYGQIDFMTVIFYTEISSNKYQKHYMNLYRRKLLSAARKAWTGNAV